MPNKKDKGEILASITGILNSGVYKDGSKVLENLKEALGKKLSVSDLHSLWAILVTLPKPEKTRKMEVKEVAKATMDIVNSFDMKEVISVYLETLNKTHRTLQQNWGRVVLAIINYWSDSFRDGNYDLRNEAICKLSFKIKGLVGDEMKYLPFI